MTIEELLISYEKELHTSLTRSNQERLEQLIADDFYEFGSSGNVWTKKDILTRLPLEDKNSSLKIESRDYKVKELSADIFLLTYVSFRENNLIEERVALRSSLWRKGQTHWQMIFHQGTFK
ncbi:MAG: nuclear transport factor 2 family protein [Bacteriovorax sp.]|nr:nuclear transport factor 2 family protein [Bacteriovorax sp.]